MTVKTADIVQCSNGRDAGRLFLVVDTAEQLVYLADGKHRKVSRPKKKNMKHVLLKGKLTGVEAERIHSGDKITDKAIRNIMAAYAAGKIEGQEGTSVG